MKYDLQAGEDKVLPNIAGLKTPAEIALAEFGGFLKAEIVLTEALKSNTKFDTSYILKIHALALAGIYTFAGKYRHVNISKGGFPFAAARFLPETMKSFEDEVLAGLPDTYKGKDELIADIAKAHGELLVIHPFRDGNGRTARILANLMASKQGFGALHFERVDKKDLDFYISAVQQAAGKKYDKMEIFIRSVFPG